MNIAIVYDSSTGTTAKAALAMGKILEDHGHQCSIQPLVQADLADVSAADLFCIGSWVKGWFIIKQHPTAESMKFIERMGDLGGKQAVVFCTYKLAAGSTLNKMAAALQQNGAKVVGQFKYRGPEPDNEFGSFVETLS